MTQIKKLTQAFFLLLTTPDNDSAMNAAISIARITKTLPNAQVREAKQRALESAKLEANLSAVARARIAACVTIDVAHDAITAVASLDDIVATQAILDVIIEDAMSALAAIDKEKGAAQPLLNTASPQFTAQPEAPHMTKTPQIDVPPNVSPLGVRSPRAFARAALDAAAAAANAADAAYDAAMDAFVASAPEASAPDAIFKARGNA